jgi:glycosyltransferase involved in cell wall biosynthesis
MKVLYVDHTGNISGAEHSLLALLNALPAEVDGVLACPPGPLVRRAGELGVPVVTVAGTEASLRISSPATIAAVANLVRSAGQVARLVRRHGVHLIHANSIRAAMITVISGRLAGIPVVAHIRDTLPPGPVSRTSLKLIASGAHAVVCNSQFTADAFTRASGRQDVMALPNPLDIADLSARRLPRDSARERIDLPESALVLGIVGQITPWKGQEEALRAASLLAAEGRDVHVLVVGEAKFLEATTRYDNAAYLGTLKEIATAPPLTGRVRFLGERADVPELLSAADALLVPSWDEPFGRVVVEGMAVGVPVIASDEGGPAEIIENGVSGLLVPGRDAEALAGAVRRLVHDRDGTQRMVAAGRTRAAEYGADRHVDALLSVYRGLVPAGQAA